MANYTETFTSTNGDVTDASELEGEFDAIATAIATKLDSDGSGTLTGNLSMGSNRLTNVSDPTAAQDAATKNYVDGAEVSGFASVADTTITTSEVSESEISITIPSNWTTYYVETRGACFIDETGTMTGPVQVTLRVRQGSGTSGTALCDSQQGLADSPPNAMTFPIYGFQEGLSATGSITYTLTSRTNGDSGQMSMRDMEWSIRARRLT